MPLFLLLSLSAFGATRHPCTPSDQVPDGQYARKSMIVFPVQIAEAAAGEERAGYRGTDPQGGKLGSDEDLYRSVARGLFVVDYPLLRFDTWLSPVDPVVGESDLSVEDPNVRRALACTDVAVIPTLTHYETSRTSDGTHSTYEMKVSMELAVWERDGEVLARRRVLRSTAPRFLDDVEDIMVHARGATVGQLKRTVTPVEKAGEVAEEAESLLAGLPAEQARDLASVLHEGRLSVNRVASVARPVRISPTLGKASHPAKLGVGWREIEDECYLHPPAADKDGDAYEGRQHECAALSRTRQVVRDLQLQTRRVPEFKLFAPIEPFVTDSNGENGTVALPLGAEEGLRVGDGYRLVSGTTPVGYARTRTTGPGGLQGAASPSTLQVVWNKGETTGLSAVEVPQIGIEIGPWFGAVIADRPDAWLPDGSKIEEGRAAFGTSLRFDVNLGASTGRFELYETNRLRYLAAGTLTGTQSAFGIEQRRMVLPRTSILGGLALAHESWSVPSGETYWDDGEEHEIRAADGHFGGIADVGVACVVHPSIVLRADVEGHLFKGVEEFTWRHDEEEGIVVPQTTGGAFHLRTSGLAVGASANWVF